MKYLTRIVSQNQILKDIHTFMFMHVKSVDDITLYNPEVVIYISHAVICRGSELGTD